MIKSSRRKHSLIDPFPLEKLIKLDFGDADGHRDRIIENAFIETTSVKLLKTDRHSIVSGPVGVGKSAIFRLIKAKSVIFKDYIDDRIIVPIEEAVSFRDIEKISKEYFNETDEAVLYQAMWYFHIIARISEELAKCPHFPQNKEEKKIEKFLSDTGITEKKLGIVKTILNVISELKIKIEAEILNTPMSLELSKDSSLDSKTKDEKVKKLNLNDVLNNCLNAIKKRNSGFLILIDKLDKFVAGEEYAIQKKYIGALINIEDDLFETDLLSFNIFIRSDLLSRLGYSGLGFDKVNDRTLRLEWTNDEIIQFVAKRVLIALETAEIAKLDEIMQSTDLKKYCLDGIWSFRYNPAIPSFLRDLLSWWRDIAREKRTSLITALSKAIVTKVFPRLLKHCNSKGESDSIATCIFLQTHFIDGRGITTPRYLLVFLKEVQKQAASYYDDNPDIEVRVDQFGKDYEWRLFPSSCVYKAYLAAKNIYIKNVCNIDEDWTKWIVHLLNSKGDKTTFNFKHFKNAFPSVSDTDLVGFIVFLESVGYLKISSSDIDFKKRLFELPILYKPDPVPNPILKEF